MSPEKHPDKPTPFPTVDLKDTPQRPQELPFVHLDWDPAANGFRATSNVPNFEWVILRYAKALKDSV